MSTTPVLAVGSCGWVDLTVPDASKLRSFYESVVGWKSSALSMGEYEDFVMEEPESGKPVAGVCHARGSNADLPPVWLVYFTVSDLDASLSECRRLDGSVLGEVRNMGTYGRMAIVRDPAGAVCAIIEPAK